MSEFLAVYVENALDANEEALARLSLGVPAMKALLDFCWNYRVAGIGFLLLSGTSDEFRRRLHQSGRAYAYFLPLLPEAAKLGSRSVPFFDAIAAGDLDTAGEIARHQRHTWAQGEEYEEDFLFFEYLMRRFFLDATEAACGALLDRWEVALQGSKDPRLDVCRALQVHDADAFDAGLEAFLAERAAKYDRLIDRELLSGAEADTETKLSVEGLALVRLAGRAGVPTKDDYPGVPSIARDDTPLALPLDSWRSVS